MVFIFGVTETQVQFAWMNLSNARKMFTFFKTKITVFIAMQI